MKWFLLMGAGFMMSVPGIKAQQPDTAQVFVHYKFSHVRDTTDRTRPYTENMVLAVGKKAGVYRSYDAQLQEAQFNKQMREQIANSGGGHIRVDRHITGSGTEYFQYPNERTMVRKESLFHSFLISEALPPIVWQIGRDTASFGGLHCQKATTHFKGRDYTAWFCPDLPLHLGPWKLNGLPGVIVEAYDAKNEVRFAFDGVEKARMLDPTQALDDQGRMPPPLPGTEDDLSDPSIIRLPEHATKTTEIEFAKLKEAARRDPSAFAQGMMSAQGGDVAGDNGRKMKIEVKAAPAPVINNPIELPEKK
jgi:GLPGLI family protein